MTALRDTARAKLNLTLDVDDLSCPRPHLACDPGRTSEGDSAKFENA